MAVTHVINPKVRMGLVVSPAAPVMAAATTPQRRRLLSPIILAAREQG